MVSGTVNFRDRRSGLQSWCPYRHMHVQSDQPMESGQRSAKQYGRTRVRGEETDSRRWSRGLARGCRRTSRIASTVLRLRRDEKDTGDSIMAKRRMSKEARMKISQAVKRRWAAYRKAKKHGTAGVRSTPGKRRARRPRKSRSGLGTNSDLARLSIDALITARRQIDQELVDRLVKGTT